MAAPLFLLAPPRSFTSVINAMIGQHPQAYGLPELNLFLYDRLMDMWQPVHQENTFDDHARHGLMRTIAELFAGEQTDMAIEMAEHWCAARERCSTGDVFGEICDKIGDGLIPVDKSPAYTFEVARMKRIIDACPEARFVHLIRHPIKQCQSIMALGNAMIPKMLNSVDYVDGACVLDPQIAWHDLNVNILNFLEQYVPPAQYITVRGEELIAKPKEQLGLICRWLGIRDDAEALEEMMHPERSPYACFGPVTALFGNDPNFLRGSSFKPHVPKTPPLDSALPWREDGAGLRPEVLALAHEFGYEA